MQTVLLIEDEIEVAAMLRQMISRSGRRALLAMNLAEAEQSWSAYKDEIDLLITDNALPDGSGIEFSEGLRKERPALKVIVASGNPELFLPAGFYRLDKPFNMTAFLETLEHVTNENSSGPTPRE